MNILYFWGGKEDLLTLRPEGKESQGEGEKMKLPTMQTENRMQPWKPPRSICHLVPSLITGKYMCVNTLFH